MELESDVTLSERLVEYKVDIESKLLLLFSGTHVSQKEVTKELNQHYFLIFFLGCHLTIT